MRTTALVAGTVMVKPYIVKAAAVRGSQANSAIRIGFLGCGGRGTADANAFVNSKKNNCRIVALADLFDDQLQKAKSKWDEVATKKGYSKIDSRLIFKGPDAFEKIAFNSQCDMIILSTPDYFHPQHLDAVVSAGKHCYCEKPAGVDVAGCRKVIEIGKRAEGKLSLEVGFQVRNAPAFSEVVNRIHNGDIGKVSYGMLHYHASAINYPEWPNASPLERRIRQFYWDNVISGDTIVDQFIHTIDIANWVMGTHPVSAIAYGGRKVRTDPGNIWDNWSVCFKYPGDVNMVLSGVQFGNYWDVATRFIGTEGVGEANYSGLANITGKKPWSSAEAAKQSEFSTAGSFNGLGPASEIKADLFIDSIISGKYHNQARQGAESALSAILGRTAGYTGEEVTWSGLLASNQSYQGEIDLSKL